ncbi:hypothetical protein [Hymenobacter edaphi]|uniref:Outer membrane protein beta-barrel domain-containing protein n=1 Tax=Hymenobacter edaphi TaxID=2211146 RepID=A0A328BDH6_9BACT|nr:hypothetical protein [Hymenobacter edaphi]RAK64705.1 hypothetical protein DLM85_18670 [Hymenobacter edaphi]
MTKHLLLLAGLIGLAGGSAHAQTERGTTLIGLSAGNLSYGRATDGFRQLSGTLTPTVGRFVADNLLVGVGVQLGHSRSESTYTGYYYEPWTSTSGYGTIGYSRRNWSAGLTPFARYYFLGRGRHRLFAEASVHAQHNWTLERYETEQGRLSNPQRFVSLGARAAVGYSYFISPRTALEVSAGYQRTYAPSGATGKLDGRIGINFLLPAGKR